ncbi:ATP-dependent DNA helicase [Asticcacaulis sp. YBE204]|uniref:ATP-dependent DNA helicase n=1 Tax=Asticcacaulis sp. YBE204 TaxID=1282363 RepID=UPI0003C3CFF2|nr:ATP-dependent DNA helicase [Asticcacaulis sp. YBE204]ESQ81231.1 helicase [Asticcacaulis sp. YBE204]
MNDFPDIEVPTAVPIPDASLRRFLPQQGFALLPSHAALSDGHLARRAGVPEAREAWGREGLLVANAPLIRQRLFNGRNHREAKHFDLLELFAFVRPAKFCAPSVAGVALAVGFTEPEGAEAQSAMVVQVALALGRELAEAPLAFRLMARASLAYMQQQNWVWAPFVEAALNEKPVPEGYVAPPALEVWSLLEEWEDQAPAGDARQVSLSDDEITGGLGANLKRAGLAELRPEQQLFALRTKDIFAPKWASEQPNMLLLEAGTGTGKTLGYLSPAQVWAEKAQGRVWISTYTKALQKQIYHDTRALFDTEAEREAKVSIRKGRENYLCLLNFQERLAPLTQGPGEAIVAALVARWIVYSRDGDIVGGDFPTWLPSLLPPQSAAAMFGALNPANLVDRRGECIYSACAHYRTCFVEKSIRKSKSAQIIIANHALVMAQAAYDLREAAKAADGQPTVEPETPGLSRLVFDEGHHVFEAADGAFSSELSGFEAAELRRWIRGNEGRGRRSRGLEQRLGDLLATRETAQEALKNLIRAAAALPAEGWSQRLTTRTQSGEMMQPVGPIEALLAAALKQIEVRGAESAAKSRFRPDTENGECEAHPCLPEVAEAASLAAKALQSIEVPLLALVRAMEDILTGEEDLDLAERTRIDGALRGLERRARMTLPAWRSLLQQLAYAEGDDPTAPSPFVDWFATVAHNGRLVDVGLHRHFVDPSVPLADYVLKPAHGVLMASATLSDSSQEEPFALARQRTGAAHLVMGAKSLRIASPFDYEAQARLFVVTDVPRDDPRVVAGAMKALFLASKGGALGLFTAIRRLKAVYEQLYRPLGEAGISLYAQHVDPLDVSDLISVFRSEQHSCLLGTDAVRDGIDVPGQALRLIAFDRIPWPRPDALHKARRAHFGAKLYDDALVRAKLAQAFGRLIRKADDRGVFVMLDSAAPTRLFASLPEGVVVQRCTLAEAIAAIEGFLTVE